ncbi:hypothetical protein LTR56_019902 [Elasticomyces elasticus]|nr:hypothetical protein LTR56_019902 [Elasticomyces elasticus]KAK3642354.1 hypothetical protein LTR22_016169 [Elasticomyces elasticus]KAK4914430.1 hypothetical protein LTR49_017350 [Elasticomyces elasticus]KAK5760406.1 hypothetical protein LTS12_009450 [Elasticomyces elasticus]
MDKSEGKTMKAVLYQGNPYEMVVKDIPRPIIRAPTDAIIRVTTAAICGSDLHNYHGLFSTNHTPYTMGHEAVGLVHEIGSKVTKYKVGDRVVIPDFFAEHGVEIVYGEGDGVGTDAGGCQAEYVLAPRADDILFPIPSGTKHELDYLLCADIFASAWTSITSTGFQPGDTVAVYGAGPVGLLAAYSALLRGALRVYSIDHVEARLHRARSIGAIPIDLRKGDPSSQILKLEPNGVKRTSDCVGFECINPEGKKEEAYILNDAVKVTSVGGGICLTGVYWHGPRNHAEPFQGPKLAHVPFDIAAWWIKNLTITGGSVPAAAQEPALIDLITAGRAKPSFVFDHVVRIEDAPEAYRLFSEHKVQKVAIDFAPQLSETNGTKRKYGEGSDVKGHRKVHVGGRDGS